MVWAKSLSDGSFAGRILVTRLRYLGDVILTTPAVAALAKRFPKASIFYLAERPYASVLERNPHIAGIIELDHGIAGTLRTISRIRRIDFDIAVDWFFNPRSAFLLRLAGIPMRIGGRRGIRSRLYTHIAQVPPGTRSAIEHHFASLRVLGVNFENSLPRVYLGQDEIEQGKDALGAVIGKKRGGPIIAIHPGGTWPAKRWPARRFATLALAVAKRIDGNTIVITGPGEEEITREVCECSQGSARDAGYRKIRQVAALLAACDAVVANDGGIMHLAVSLGKPAVGILGPTDPRIWFPYENLGPFSAIALKAACAPCDKHVCDSSICLDSVSVDDVFEVLEEVLSRRWHNYPRL